MTPHMMLNISYNMNNNPFIIEQKNIDTNSGA
jgi:hypothetical protein